MTKSRKSFNFQELAFQLILHGVVLVGYAVSRRHPEIDLAEFSFFMFYAAASAVINYLLLPLFYYPKRYWAFGISVLLLIASVILIEETVMEQLFFPDSRGQSFSNIFPTLVAVMPVILILTGFKFAWDAMAKQRELDTLQAAVEESELQFLKSQINPHFLFNNLNNLYAYALENSPKTPQIILELSGLLRYMLYECKEDVVPLPKEIEQLVHFVQLNELQIEERGEINFEVTGKTHGFQIAPLILIVFIENAFKHSQSSQSAEIEIDIQLNVSSAGLLKFSCSNSFGQRTNTENLSKGIGLANVRKRLNLIYPEAHQLSIHEDNDSYRVQLSIQLDQLTSTL